MAAKKRNTAAHFCAALIFVGDGLYVVDYEDLSSPGSARKVKLPGGNQENDENPSATIRREFCEEVCADGLDGTPALLHERRVSSSHTQYYFGCQIKPEARVRDCWLSDDDGEEQVGPPRLVSIAEALQVLHRPHREALAIILEGYQDFQAKAAIVGGR